MANPQSTSILEQIYQVIYNLTFTLDLQSIYLDKYNPWAVILADTAFVVWSTYHTMLQSMTNQLMFVQNMVLNTPFIYDLEAIRRLKQ